MKKSFFIAILLQKVIFADYYTIDVPDGNGGKTDDYNEFMREDIWVPNRGLYYIYHRLHIDFSISLESRPDKGSHPINCVSLYHKDRLYSEYCDWSENLEFKGKKSVPKLNSKVGKINETDEVFLTYQLRDKSLWTAHYRRIPKEQVNKIFDKYGVNLNVAWQYLLKQKILQKEFRKIGGLAQFGLYRAKKDGVKMFKEPNAKSDAIETFDPIMKKALVVKTGEPKNGFILVVCETGEEGYVSLSELAQIK